jgi:CRISPR-associated protein Csb2
MSLYLRIHVHFLGGHYHGEEWPPAPMRLMQAMVAGSAHAGRLRRDVDLFAWLERQTPPIIHAPHVAAGKFTAYVPRNSDDITMRELYKGTSPHEASAKRRARYDGQDTSRRWINDAIIYEWQVDDAAQAECLGDISHELVCLGRAEDLAYASFDLAEAPLQEGSNTWQPAPPTSFTRNLLRIPVAGSLASLECREHARRARIESKEFVNPPVIYGERNYDLGAAGYQWPFLLYDLDGMEPGSRLGWRHNEGVVVAAMIRHALDARVPDSLRGYATGHVGDGDPDDRLSWVPLPSIGHQHADGRIRRALLLGPKQETFDSLRWLEIMHALAHALLIQHGKPVGTMEPTDEISGAVRPYLEAGTRWHTVTPLVTHGRTTRGGKQKGKFDRRKAEKLILHALAKAGLPYPVRMHYQSAPFERSGRAAREYRVPQHLSGLSRFHVSVEFPEPVSGPVLAGVGSHFGLGLFARSR